MADGLDILVVSQFFSPEMGAPAARFHDFGKLLVERGPNPLRRKFELEIKTSNPPGFKSCNP